MSTRTTMIAVLAAALTAGAGATVATAHQSAGTASPLSCEIATTAEGNMVQLEGMLHADQAVSGSYRFKVESAGRGGHSNISQGGQFSAGAGETVKLGKVMLGGSAADYNATLEVTANGMTLTCDGSDANRA